ncbi:tape measure protein [Microbacterium phage Phonegingi]|nr:tape measure protein [Microbacterium phage Phonegingi]
MALDLGELVAFLDLDTSKFDKATDRMPSTLSGKTAAFGAAGLVLGGVVAAAMSQGLNDALSFEDSLATISGSLALTEAESARVGAAAGRVYAQNYGESVEQVQSVVGGIITQIEGMGEASDSVVDGMTAKVLNYADAFGFETSEAIAMVQQLMTSGLASSADEAMDLMTASMQRVPEALRGDLSDAITEYGPLLADLGFNGVEAFDLLASGAERGMYGIDKAGDAVKEFGIRATDMSAASKTAYDALGMSQEDMTNQLLAGGETAKDAFTTIVNGLRNIEDPAAQSQAALALFGTPLEDLGVKNIPSFLDSLGSLGTGMQDTAGAAEAMGEKMGSSTASQMEAMNRQVQIMMSDLMSGLLPILNAVFGFLAENPMVLQAVALAIGVLALAFIGLSVATWAANAAFLASPITWIILAIVALVAAIIWLVMNWDQVVAWITEVWSGFITWITEVIDGFVAWWNGMWEGFASWIGQVWEGFVSWIVGVWSGFVGWLMGIVNGIVSWWNGLWAGIGAFFTSVWNGIVSWAMGFIAGFIAGWQGIWNGLLGFFSGLWSNITNGITSAWNGAMSFLGSIPGRIMEFFGGIGSWLLNAGKDLIQGFIDGIGSMIGAVGDAIGGVMDFVGGFFPHSPAKRGQFSGSGWRAVLNAGEAISAQFARGLHGSDPFEGFGEGLLAGVVRVQPDFDRRMGELVDTPAYTAAVNAQSAALGDVDAKAGTGTTYVTNYYAAENRSLSAEEDLFAALGSPRVTNGKGDD